MPDCLAIGIEESVFWNLTPRKLKIYTKAFEKKTKREDEMLWLSGKYTFEAVSTAIYNAFRDKKDKYIPYMDRPYTSAPIVEVTEDEQKKQMLEEFVLERKRSKMNFDLWKIEQAKYH